MEAIFRIKMRKDYATKDRNLVVVIIRRLMKFAGG